MMKFSNSVKIGKRVATPEEIVIGETLGFRCMLDGFVSGVVKFNPEFRHDATIEDVRAGIRSKGAVSFTVVHYADGLGFYPHLALILDIPIYKVE